MRAVGQRDLGDPKWLSHWQCTMEGLFPVKIPPVVLEFEQLLFN